MIIYGLVDPRTDCVRYVGFTADPVERLRCHLNERGHNHRLHWIWQLRNLGIKPELVTIEEVAANWQDAERFWIANFRAAGADLVNGSDGGTGGRQSATSRAKMSVAKLGVKQTREHRLKIKRANKGRKFTDEHRRKLSVAASQPKNVARLRAGIAQVRASKVRK